MALSSKRDNELLRRDHEALRRDYAQARTQLAVSDGRISELTVEIARLAGLVAQSNDRITELLAVAQRKKRGARKKKPKEPEPPASLNEEAKASFADRPVAPKLPDKKKKAKKKARPTGRKPVPDHLAAEEHRVKPEACGGCGGSALEAVGEEVEVKLHVVKEHQRRRVVRRKICRCKDCGQRTTARSLPSPFARSKATCEWLAWLVHQKFVMLAPLDRIRRDLASRGIPVAMSYLVTQVERAADLLGPVDGEHWRQLLAGPWMATDATGLKVLIPGLTGCHHGHLEVYRSDAAVVMQYEPHKGADVLVQKLAPFKGLLVADAEHRHNAVYADGTVLEAGCNAHGRRKFRDAETEQPVLAAEGGAFVAAYYVAESEAQKMGLTGAALKAWRQDKVPPIAASLLRWMDAVEPALTPNDALAKVIRYFRNHWDALFRFVNHPEIPIDNSASEREFQHVAKLRLNSLFAGSTEGAHRAATLLGVAATCRSLGVDTVAYLAWAFTRLGTHRDVYGLSAAELTPAAFAQTRAGPKTS